MNKFISCGRLVRDPEIKTGTTSVARYTLAIDRRYKKEGEATADFINYIAFGKSAEFAEKYLKKGMKILVTGRIQTGSYTNKDGIKVYTTDVVVEETEFVESKGGSAPSEDNSEPVHANNDDAFARLNDNNGFMNVQVGADEELPFA